MKRAIGKIFRPQERPRTDGLQGETERTGPSSQSSSFNSYGPGDQFNAPGGTQNISKGSGNQYFQAPVYLGTDEPPNPSRDCLRSLAFPEMESRSHDIDAAAEGTCEWLLRHKTYTNWASCDRGLLWIKGKPGSGKSTLLRYVLNNVTAIPNIRERALILSFFFHGRGTELQKTPLGLFRSLLYQLLIQVPDALPDLVATFQQRCETVGKPGEKWQWHPCELQRFFKSSLLKVLKTRPVWLFVDALDECSPENAVELVGEFKSLLQRLPSINLKEFRICFTCRHYPILDLDGVFTIYTEEENKKDISTFVRDKLSSFRVRTSSMIPDLITERAQGVFLWAWLVVNQVLDLERKGAGSTKIDAEIRSVPQMLDDLYRELIRNMGPDSLKLIQWICFATRPLSLDELRWALVVEADCPHRSLYECQSAGDYTSDEEGMKRRVQTLSCGLAEITSDTKVVQFIHQSAHDFFVEKGLLVLDGAAGPDFLVGIAHYRLSRICIHYLAMEEIGRLATLKRNDIASEFPFLHYATTSWVAHTKESDARSVLQDDLPEYFAWPSNTLVERWARAYRILEKYSDCLPEGTSLVHVLSRYGVVGALWAILKRAGVNIDPKDSHGRTPLSWAAGSGQEAVVKLLLKKGADIDLKDRYVRTPLSYAAEQGHEAVVKLLLEKGAYIDSKSTGTYNAGQTPIIYAAERGHEAVVKLLLEKGADIDSKSEGTSDDGRVRTLLSYAAEHGHEAVVTQLLEKGVDVDWKGDWDRTPLSYAAEQGHKAVVKLLLEKGADIDSKSCIMYNFGRTPLMYADRHEAVFKLLLEKGANIDCQDQWGLTALSLAAISGKVAVMTLLLERGADLESKDNSGQTPLSKAASRGQEAVVKLLLEKRADLESRDKQGRTPLSWSAGQRVSLAATDGHEAVVKLLLEKGADIESKDNDSRTPLSWAATDGHEAVVKLLLEKGADAQSKDKSGRTPLLRVLRVTKNPYSRKEKYEAVAKLLASVT
ncbi:ankyrin repeat-containing domain protein [Microdochium trichocladiopsis]|uniref:Ankyrin repeat-containing domain protein n=1 Tax=Microdochium trichocladiopsis TaxID=1682393 RepID=A0A9P8XR42_9PEZI|nr:ankyrin repeat-containing domain protein [Microdochium trichocladiopsis]KAH7012312.1 ankyrin repeat-containing domain protein [Microdochium trichocladiopsis]